MCARWRPLSGISLAQKAPGQIGEISPYQRNPHGFTNEISKYVKKKSRNSGAQGGTVGFIRIPGFRHPDLVREGVEGGGDAIIL